MHQKLYISSQDFTFAISSLLLCLVFVMCWGGVFAGPVGTPTSINLIYKPTVTPIEYFQVVDTEPSFTTNVKPTEGTLVADKNVTEKESETVYICWHYLNENNDSANYTVTLSSQNGGVLKNETLDTKTFSYKITLTPLTAKTNHTEYEDLTAGEKPLTAPVSFKFKNSLISGTSYEREFWGGVSLLISSFDKPSPAELVDGNYKDTITITLSTT